MRRKIKCTELLLLFPTVAIVVVLGGLLLSQSRHGLDGQATVENKVADRVSLDVSHVRLPNEWEVDLLGDHRRITLTRVGGVEPAEDHCEVGMFGVVSTNEGELPFSIEVDFEPVDSRELYVSRIRGLSVPQDRVLEKELKKMSRLYCNHLQKTLWVKR